MEGLQAYFNLLLIIYLLGVLASIYMSSKSVWEYFKVDRDIEAYNIAGLRGFRLFMKSCYCMVMAVVYILIWLLLIIYSWGGVTLSLVYLSKRVKTNKRKQINKENEQ